MRCGKNKEKEKEKNELNLYYLEGHLNRLMTGTYPSYTPTPQTSHKGSFVVLASVKMITGSHVGQDPCARQEERELNSMHIFIKSSGIQLVTPLFLLYLVPLDGF